MMRCEFETLLGKEVSLEEYMLIELVYTYYPNFGDKIEAVKMYKQYGIFIFEDLRMRALLNKYGYVDTDMMNEMFGYKGGIHKCEE